MKSDFILTILLSFILVNIAYSQESEKDTLYFEYEYLFKRRFFK